MADASETEDKKKTKIPRIPKLRFRQAVKRAQKEKREDVPIEIETQPRPRRSSIPKPVTKQATEIQKPDGDRRKTTDEDEFDKIYDQLTDSPIDININILSSKIGDSVEIDDNFEEIVHAYNDNKPSMEKPKRSRIPTLKHKHEPDVECIDTPNKSENINETKHNAKKSKPSEIAQASKSILKKSSNIGVHEKSNKNSNTEEKVIEVKETQILVVQRHETSNVNTFVTSRDINQSEATQNATEVIGESNQIEDSVPLIENLNSEAIIDTQFEEKPIVQAFSNEITMIEEIAPTTVTLQEESRVIMDSEQKASVIRTDEKEMSEIITPISAIVEEQSPSYEQIEEKNLIIDKSEDNQHAIIDHKPATEVNEHQLIVEDLEKNSQIIQTVDNSTTVIKENEFFTVEELTPIKGVLEERVPSFHKMNYRDSNTEENVYIIESSDAQSSVLEEAEERVPIVSTIEYEVLSLEDTEDNSFGSIHSVHKINDRDLNTEENVYIIESQSSTLEEIEENIPIMSTIEYEVLSLEDTKENSSESVPSVHKINDRDLNDEKNVYTVESQSSILKEIEEKVPIMSTIEYEVLNLEDTEDNSSKNVPSVHKVNNRDLNSGETVYVVESQSSILEEIEEKVPIKSTIEYEVLNLEGTEDNCSKSVPSVHKINNQDLNTEENVYAIESLDASPSVLEEAEEKVPIISTIEYEVLNLEVTKENSSKSVPSVHKINDRDLNNEENVYTVESQSSILEGMEEKLPIMSTIEYEILNLEDTEDNSSKNLPSVHKVNNRDLNTEETVYVVESQSSILEEIEKKMPIMSTIEYEVFNLEGTEDNSSKIVPSAHKINNRDLNTEENVYIIESSDASPSVLEEADEKVPIISTIEYEVLKEEVLNLEDIKDNSFKSVPSIHKINDRDLNNEETVYIVESQPSILEEIEEKVPIMSTIAYEVLNLEDTEDNTSKSVPSVQESNERYLDTEENVNIIESLDAQTSVYEEAEEKVPIISTIEYEVLTLEDIKDNSSTIGEDPSSNFEHNSKVIVDDTREFSEINYAEIQTTTEKISLEPVRLLPVEEFKMRIQNHMKSLVTNSNDANNIMNDANTINSDIISDNNFQENTTYNSNKVSVAPLDTNKSLDTPKQYVEDIKNINLEAQETIVMDVEYKMNIVEDSDEDIPILKGKVNRMLIRLNSKDGTDYIKKKTEVDIPKTKSVLSTIALFEQKTDVKPTKDNKPKIKPINYIGVTDDSEHYKPKVVNGVLKSTTTQNLPYDDNNKSYNNNDVALAENKTKTHDEIANVDVFHFNDKVLKPNYNATAINDFNRQLSIDNRIKRLTSINRSEGLRTTKSEHDLRVVKGKVNEIIHNMKSRENLTYGRDVINPNELPRRKSVSEKIAWFEGKLSLSTCQNTTVTRNAPQPREPVTEAPNEELQRKIEELENARQKYGRRQNMTFVLLANGVEMPIITVGTCLIDKWLTAKVVSAAIDLGYRAIDTAYIYGNEKEVGEGIQKKIQDGTVTRAELFITSKLWSTFHRPDLVEEACRKSLEIMGLDYFDQYLIHNPMSFKEDGESLPKIANVLQYSKHDYLDAWFGMERLVSKGLVRSIGVSNFNESQLQKVIDKAKVKPVVNQVECHPYLSQSKMEAFCTERNVTLSCYGVLGSKGTPAHLKAFNAPVIDDPLIQVMAAGIGITPAQLLIRYQIQLGRAVVVKTINAARLYENLQAMDITLTDTQMDAISALNRNKRAFTFAGMGDTHKNYPFKTQF